MKYVVYYRVSTKKQATSGLGLEAQKTIVQNYLKKTPITSLRNILKLRHEIVPTVRN